MAARAGSRERKLVVLLALQLAALSIAVFVPIGFDHPSSWGLDFGHLLILAAFYLVTLLAGLVLSVQCRRWWILAGEVALPSALLVLAFTGVLGV